MINYSNRFQLIQSKKAILATCLFLTVLSSCTKPEEEVDLYMTDDLKVNLYSQSIETDLIMDSIISTDSVLFQNELLSQDNTLPISISLKMMQTDITSSVSYDYFVPKFYLSQKVKKNNLLTPIGPYLKSLNSGLA